MKKKEPIGMVPVAKKIKECRWKRGDLVKMKSLEWFNEQLKDKDGDIVSVPRISVYNGDEQLVFDRYSASLVCGKVGKIDYMTYDDEFRKYICYSVVFGDYELWAIEEWFDPLSEEELQLFTDSNLQSKEKK